LAGGTAEAQLAIGGWDLPLAWRQAGFSNVGIPRHHLDNLRLEATPRARKEVLHLIRGESVS